MGKNQTQSSQKKQYEYAIETSHGDESIYRNNIKA